MQINTINLPLTSIVLIVLQNIIFV